MKRSILSLLLTVTILVGCGVAVVTSDDKADTTVLSEASVEETSASVETDEVSSNESEDKSMASDVLMIADQGMFSSGGTVTDPIEGELKTGERVNEKYST